MSDALRIVIAEDEAVVARRIARLTAEILGPRAGEIAIVPRVDEARAAIEQSPPDLLILDLNLEGEEGFDLLRYTSSCAFQTIVVSAATGRALEAFQYGVGDFVPKPFGRERLERALERVLTPSVRAERPIEHLGIRGAGARSELVLTNGTTALHDKLLDRLEGVLPETLPTHPVLHRRHPPHRPPSHERRLALQRGPPRRYDAASGPHARGGGAGAGGVRGRAA